MTLNVTLNVFHYIAVWYFKMFLFSVYKWVGGVARRFPLSVQLALNRGQRRASQLLVSFKRVCPRV